MQRLKEMLLQEVARLHEIKQVVDDRLGDVPDGYMRITSNGKRHQFMHCSDDYNNKQSKRQGVYIKQDDQALAYRLAQKSYDLKIKKLVDRRLKQLEKITKEYADDEIEQIYNELHSIRKTLIKPVEIPWEQRLLEWKNTPYTGKDFGAGIPEIYTKKGERVRSKSEKILADIFSDMGIEYKYECPLKLNGYGVIYPDFTFLRKRDCKEIYWEHDGRMDDPVYAQKAVKKINLYMTNGIFPGDRLILSFESSEVVVNDKIVKLMISKHLA